MSLDVTVDSIQCKKDDNIKCEDYFIASTHNNEGEDKFFCLCDGASESYDSLRWSKIIAEQYIEEKFNNKNYFKPDISSNFIKLCIDKYKKEVDFNSLSWSHQLAFLRGSFSTLLGVSIINGLVHIFAVGDSVAFKLKRTKKSSYIFFDTFQYKNTDEFKNKPTLLSSNFNMNDFLYKNDFSETHTNTWHVKDGDIILLMTDAISEWLISNKKHIKKLMSFFQPSKRKGLSRQELFKREDLFKQFVYEERAKKNLKIDDTTVVKLEFRKT